LEKPHIVIFTPIRFPLFGKFEISTLDSNLKVIIRSLRPELGLIEKS
jgi:hypothetical protein